MFYGYSNVNGNYKQTR